MGRLHGHAGGRTAVTASPSILPGQWNPPLLRAEGTALLTAHQAIVKGALESELAVDAIVAPRPIRRRFAPVMFASASEQELSPIAPTAAHDGP